MRNPVFILAAFIFAAAFSFGVYVNVGSNLSVNQTVTHVPLPPLKNLTNQTLCISCMNITIPVVILNNSDIAACDPSLVATPHYTEYTADWYSVEEPYYLDPLTDDCSIFGFEPNIMQDLDQKLALLDAMEAQVNSTEVLAAQLFSQGNETLAGISIASYQDDPNDLYATPAELTYPSVNSRYYDVELSYPAAPFGRVAVQDLENFHYAYEYAINAKNDTRALKNTLQSLVQAFEDFSDKGRCMFGGGKEYYASLLRMRYSDTLRYVNETRSIIHHARDFAADYTEYKEYIDRSECLGSMIGEYELPPEMANVTLIQNESRIPAVITQKFPNISYITSITLSENRSYIVQAKLPKKLLGLIPVEMDVKSEIDAENGEVIKEEKPWWSFLLFD